MKTIIDGIEREYERLIVHPSSHLRDFVTAPIRVECTGIDFRQCPDTISAIPLILNVAPIIWRLGGTWEDKFVDHKLMKSLDLSRRALQKLYPQYTFSGRVISICEDPNIEENDGVALLYSGGLDSTFSFFDFVLDRPLLLTIHGDITRIAEEAKQWEHISLSAARLVDRFSAEQLSITSNYTYIFSPSVLELFPDLPAGYWSSVQHGLGFTGVAAPIMHCKKKRTLVIGASYAVGSNRSWGSHPFVEGVLEWCGGSVRHHGYTHDRIEKIECLSSMAKDHGYTPQLIVCSNGKRSSINCLSCSKCFRTLANILVCDCDPRDFGFELNCEEAFRLLKRSVPKKLRITDNEIHFWGNIKAESIRRDAPGRVPEFKSWIKSISVRKSLRQNMAATIRKIIPHRTRKKINLILRRNNLNSG